MSPELYRIVIGLLLSITAMVLLNRYLNVHAFFSLLIASMILGLTVGKPFEEIISVMQTGFGTLLQQIGFIVALGSCLGMVMEKTGAMTVISQRILDLFGARHAVIAMSVIGVIVGIPVFCDSGFIILSRLIPSIAAQASLNPAQLTLALASGLYTTHTLVPPTPGPLAAAANLGIASQLGTVILVGIIGSIPVAMVSYFASKKIGRKIMLEAITHAPDRDSKGLSVFTSFLPLILPIVLIALAMLPTTLGWTGVISKVLVVAGQPVMALGIGLLLAAAMLIRKDQKASWPGWISEALKDAGVILLITGAGGAFGYVIKSSGIDTVLASAMKDSPAHGIAFLLTGFGFAALLKTAQGSTTSAMIITSALLTPLTVAAGFDTPVQLAVLILAIGGGAMTVSHANDSYFWVVSQFGGLQTRDAFRSFTLITFLQGVTALFTSILLFILL
ncbi:MAG: GntP family permease [Chryseosolibacter sp.]